MYGTGTTEHALGATAAETLNLGELFALRSRTAQSSQWQGNSGASDLTLDPPIDRD
jgi:hypothetical protein